MEVTVALHCAFASAQSDEMHFSVKRFACDFVVVDFARWICKLLGTVQSYDEDNEIC
jgi:hypothetical protein